MKKVDWLKIIKISIGCCFAVFLADWIGLRSATSAGIIALLSIQNTKKETLTIAGKRISAFFIAVAIAYGGIIFSPLAFFCCCLPLPAIC